MTTSLSRKRPAKPPARAVARRFGVTGLAAVGATVAMAALAAGPGSAAAVPDQFKVTNLVSDTEGAAPAFDPNLVNPWGAATEKDSALWVSDEAPGVSTLYEGTPAKLNPVNLVVSIPNGRPTGQVSNSGTITSPHNFVVRSGSQSAPALFMFANLAGQISAWSPGVGVANPRTDTSTHAFEVASVRGGSFTGLAISGGTLYAADFARGTVDVFNSSFRSEFRFGAFTDFAIPPAFKPYNVQNLGGRIYVTYARTDARTGQRGSIRGGGFVDVFSPQGRLQKRLISGGLLDSPYGLVIAPPQFGAFSNDLLVGNFGNGLINAYNPQTGRFAGTLRDSSGAMVHEDGLRALTLGTGEAAGEQVLLFTAAIDGGHHGLVGDIIPAG